MTSPDQGSDGFGGRLRSLLRGLKRRRAPPSSASQVTFSLMYDRFREILGLNNVTLEMFADLEERLSGRKPFAMEAVAQRIRKAALDVFGTTGSTMPCAASTRPSRPSSAPTARRPLARW